MAYAKTAFSSCQFPIILQDGIPIKDSIFSRGRNRSLYLPHPCATVMSGPHEPYISADESPLELTARVLGVGIVLGVLMTAANAYLGLYAGMTVSASIP